MFLDTLIFIDLLMSDHVNALIVCMLIFMCVLVLKAFNIFKKRGEISIEKKETITKKSKSAI